MEEGKVETRQKHLTHCRPFSVPSSNSHDIRINLPRSFARLFLFPGNSYCFTCGGVEEYEYLKVITVQREKMQMLLPCGGVNRREDRGGLVKSPLQSPLGNRKKNKIGRSWYGEVFVSDLRNITFSCQEYQDTHPRSALLRRGTCKFLSRLQAPLLSCRCSPHAF